MPIESTIARAQELATAARAAREARKRRSSSGCIHRGARVGVVPCLPCRKKTGLSISLPTYACALHGTCTVDRPIEGVACCAGCADKTPPDAQGWDQFPRVQPVERAVLLTGGIGDAFAIEAALTDPERNHLETIYYACPAARAISALWRLLPNYPVLRSHVILPTGNAVLYEQAAVEKVTGPLPVEDWSIRKVFPQHLPYRGSSFLAHRLADPPDARGPYAVIVPRSRGFGRWSGRDFDAGDWSRAVGFLNAHDLAGLVLTEGAEAIPASPRLVNLQGKTTLAESIELLKGAVAYLGIDSCLSVLAAKLLPAERLAVKSTNNHCYQWARTYYAPHVETPFLQRRLEVPAWS